MYMSYCRQEGTLAELRICLADAADHVFGDAECAVSEREIRNFRDMVEYFYDWCNHMMLIDSDGDLDYEELDKICEAMAKDYYDDEEDDPSPAFPNDYEPEDGEYD